MDRQTTRQQIIAAADRLFYEQGFEHTSFADIASMVKISRGNFYYHFKTKDQILDAVIQHRLNRTTDMLDNWQLQGDNPAERIRSFIHILINNRLKIKQYGCPVGTLNTELVKLDHASQDKANQLFVLFRTWLRKQFRQLGLKTQADRLAMHLLALSQGVATVAQSFHDEKFIRQEVRLINQWLDDCIAQAA